MHAHCEAANMQQVPFHDEPAYVPDNPRMEVSSLDEKAIHEENAEQDHHAKSVGYHNVARQGGHKSEDRDADLVDEEEACQVHEEPA